jgi:hypothetical protein
VLRVLDGQSDRRFGVKAGSPSAFDVGDQVREHIHPRATEGIEISGSGVRAEDVFAAEVVIRLQPWRAIDPAERIR